MKKIIFLFIFLLICFFALGSHFIPKLLSLKEAYLEEIAPSLPLEFRLKSLTRQDIDSAFFRVNHNLPLTSSVKAIVIFRKNAK